jgi:hypothetical protein
MVRSTNWGIVLEAVTTRNRPGMRFFPSAVGVIVCPGCGGRSGASEKVNCRPTCGTGCEPTDKRILADFLLEGRLAARGTMLNSHRQLPKGEQSALRNGSHISALLQGQVHPINLPGVSPVFSCVLF